MLTPSRIYVSVPNDGRLQPDQLDIKKGIMDKIRLAGFEPQEFKACGDLAQIPWSFANVQYKLGRCQGAVVLGLIRWDVWDAQNKYRFNTAYNHYEGALALAKDLPTLILMHEHVHKAGIALKGRAPNFVKLPDMVSPSWLQTDPFVSKFDEWVSLVKSRRHIFFGYSSKAQGTANRIKDYLNGKGVSVMDGAIDVNPATTKIDEIERASKSCMGSIFLLTKDEEKTTANNVIFEAGYFMHAKGADKTLFIAEEGTKMPADIGGRTYLPLQNPDDISPIEKDLEKFIVNNL